MNKRLMKKEILEQISLIEKGEVCLTDMENDAYEIIGVDFNNNYLLDILFYDEEENRLDMELFYCDNKDTYTVEHYSSDLNELKEEINEFIDDILEDIKKDRI